MILKTLVGYLLKKKEGCLRPSFFDSEWYLNVYHDVKASKINPWIHFNRYGRYEGRFSCKEHADIWLFNTRSDIEKIEADFDSSTQINKNYFAWLLGRWYARADEWDSVLKAMEQYDFNIDAKNKNARDLMQGVLYYESLVHSASLLDAEAFLNSLKSQYPNAVVFDLLEANQCAPQVDSWLSHVNQIYDRSNLAGLTLIDNRPHFDALHHQEVPLCGLPHGLSEPLVSIIVPMFNAEESIRTVLRSLLSQSWQNIEVIVVDDASSDASCEAVESIASQDARVRLIRNQYNQGPYAVRNQGLQDAKGEFITVHDADDWSHAQKIESQLMPLLQNPSMIATMSHWARLTNDLQFGRWKTPSSWVNWVHQNVSSLLFRRSVFDTLGYWDNVKCNADMEYYHRILAVYGKDAIKPILPNVPLSMGRLSDSSITQQNETSIFSIFSGSRCDYTQSFMVWHAKMKTPSDLYMPFNPDQRLFPVPSSICHK